MISIQIFYPLLGALLLIAGWQSFRQKQIRESAFWMLLAVLIGAADALPDVLTGAGVLLLAALALARGPRVETHTRPLNSARLFLPLLALPTLTLLGVFLLPLAHWQGESLITPKQASLIAVALAALFSFFMAWRITRTSLAQASTAGTPLLRTVGWALLLPLALATLGAVFAKLGIGQTVADALRSVMPLESKLVAVLCLGLGTALLTALMGNAFAAWPIMFGGIGLPFLVQQHGADPAALAALTMLTGYCGTLLTPMAANYNIVPAALLELDNRYAVIRAQVATALPLMGCNLLLMFWLPFW